MEGFLEIAKYVWRPVSSVPSCKPLIDHSRSGICRRPIVDNKIWRMVVQIITDANRAGNSREAFGASWRVPIKRNEFANWKPKVVQEFNNAIAKKVASQVDKDAKTDVSRPAEHTAGPCHFGHTNLPHRAHGREVWLKNPQVS